ncbi:hypothetical protein QTP88_004878 [Uroleucon formosanum]
MGNWEVYTAAATSTAASRCTLFPVVAPGPEPVGPLVPVHSSVVPTAVAPHSRKYCYAVTRRFVFRLTFRLRALPADFVFNRLSVFLHSPRSTIGARIMIHALCRVRGFKHIIIYRHHAKSSLWGRGSARTTSLFRLTREDYEQEAASVGFRGFVRSMFDENDVNELITLHSVLNTIGDRYR